AREPSRALIATGAAEPRPTSRRNTTRSPSIANVGATPCVTPDADASTFQTVRPVSASRPTRSRPALPCTYNTKRPPARYGCDTGFRSVRTHPGSCAVAAGFELLPEHAASAIARSTAAIRIRIYFL